MARQRGILTLIGAASGLSLYLLLLLIDAEWLAGRAALAVTSFALSFFLGLTILTGPLGLRRAALGAGAVAAAISLALSLAALRFASAEEIGLSPLAMASLVTLCTVTWPFLITAGSPEGWRDYPGLFRDSWGILVRLAVALMFAGLVWLVLFLCDEILGLVGVRLLSELFAWPPAPWVITGTVLGLAIAVVDEIADALSPGLLLRLLRLLLPVVLVVLALFLAVLPFRGLQALFGAVSSAGILMFLSALAVTLVTSALDQEDALAVSGPLMRRATRVLAALAPVPVALAAWALAIRVADHGWTPERLLAATAAGVLLAYGLAYLAAVPRRDWMARIRQANVVLALAQIALALAWLTLLSPEAISARSQLARFEAGKTPVADLDLAALDRWGQAGAAARDRLQALAASDPALAARLAGAAPEAAPDPVQAQQALAAALPMSPDTPETRALRDRILAAVADYDLARWQAACDAHLAEGGPGCVLVFADLWPDPTGPEAVLVARDPDGYPVLEGFSFPGDGLQRHALSGPGALPDDKAIGPLIDALQKAPPATAALGWRQLVLPQGGGLFLVP